MRSSSRRLARALHRAMVNSSDRGPLYTSHVALSSLQVVAGAGLVSLLTMVAAWGRPEAAKAWAKTLVGDPYRHHALEVKVPVPARVRLAVFLAWAVVVVSALRAVLIPLQILSLEVLKGAASVDCYEPPCVAPPAPTGPEFDAVSAGLLAVYLIATGAAMGAFARWAWDAVRDMNQVRRVAPLVTGGVLVGVALGIHPLLELAEQEFEHGTVSHSNPDLLWLATLVQVGVVVVAAVSIGVARRSAS